MNYLRIKNGTVYDPKNGLDGEVTDLWIADGKVVSAPSPETIALSLVQTINATGLVVMPGGIDMHCHIVGSKVNAGRLMQTGENRDSPVARRETSFGSQLHSGSDGSLPSLSTTGYKYTGLGYTTCFDAAISPLAARHVHHEFEHIPNVDTGFYTLIGNNHFAMQCIADAIAI